MAQKVEFTPFFIPSMFTAELKSNLNSHFEDLPQGLNFSLNEKQWNMQITNAVDQTIVRLSSENELHMWCYEGKNGNLKHSTLSATTDSCEEDFSTEYTCNINYCSHQAPKFVEMIKSGSAFQKSPPLRIPSAIHNAALTWLGKCKNPNTFIIPLSKGAVIANSQYDPLIKKIDEEFFKKVFKTLALLSAIYLVYSVVSPFFAKKVPAPEMIAPPR